MTPYPKIHTDLLRFMRKRLRMMLTKRWRGTYAIPPLRKISLLWMSERACVYGTL